MLEPDVLRDASVFKLIPFVALNGIFGATNEKKRIL